MALRLLLFASLVLLSFRLSGPPTFTAKTGCGIDPNGTCPVRPGASSSEAPEGGFIDPNG